MGLDAVILAIVPESPSLLHDLVECPLPMKAVASCHLPGYRLLALVDGPRYYGLGYERGPWPDFVAVFDFLRSRFPGCSIYYGHDSDDPAKLTEELQDRLTAHFYEVGNAPFYELIEALGIPIASETKERIAGRA